MQNQLNIILKHKKEMTNEVIHQKSWWQRHWKWVLPVIAIILMLIGIFTSSGIGGIGSNIVQAYADTELYEKALEKVTSNQIVTELLGDIEPIDKLAILEGEVHYTNQNQTVNSSIRLIGTKGKARMDFTALKVNNQWTYQVINVRIKNPPELKQTIQILKMD